MYEKDGIKYVSPFERWNLPERDLSGMPKAVSKDCDFFCPNCGEKLPWMDDEYEVDGKEYPQTCNEYLWGCPDGTIHDYDVVHCCPKCKTESWFRDGCF